MKTTIYSPTEQTRPYLAVVAPYPFSGTPENTGGRLQVVADAIGATVIGAQRFGTGTTVIDLAARERLSPKNFAQTQAAAGKELAHSGILNDYQALIGWGDSASGATVMGMQLGSRIFDGLLLRNCVNHRAAKRPENPIIGTANFLAYLALGEIRKPADVASPSIPPSPDEPWRRASLRAVTEMRHYRPVMLSPYTTLAARELAQDPEIPIRYVDITHTFTGSPEAATRFALEMQQLRSRANRALDNDPYAYRTEVDWSIEDWYHSDLLRPDYAARNLEETIAIMSDNQR